MGDFIFAGGLLLWGGTCVYAGYRISRDISRRQLRLERQRGDRWYQRYREACVSVDEANAAAWAAEKRAAVDEAQAIVMGRVA